MKEMAADFTTLYTMVSRRSCRLHMVEKHSTNFTKISTISQLTHSEFTESYEAAWKEYLVGRQTGDNCNYEPDNVI